MTTARARQEILIRVASVLIAFGFAAVLPHNVMLLVMVMLGQGHFLLAYLYQVEAGRVNEKKIFVYLLFLAFCVWLGAHISLEALSLITSITFLVHFAFDEARLLNNQHSLFTTLEASPLVLLYTGIVADAYFKWNVFPIMGVISLCALAVYGFLAYRSHRKPNATSYAFLAWGLLTLFLYVAVGTFMRADALVWFWGLVITHYAIWYFYYWFKLAGQPAKRTVYLWRAFGINIGLWLATYFWLGNQALYLALIFSPVAFDVWTMMHWFSTIRPKEYMVALRLPRVGILE